MRLPPDVEYLDPHRTPDRAAHDYGVVITAAVSLCISCLVIGAIAGWALATGWLL